MERIMALVEAGEIRAAESRVIHLGLTGGISGHDRQIALRAITKTKARLAADKEAAEVAREAKAARKQKKGKKPPKG